MKNFNLSLLLFMLIFSFPTKSSAVLQVYESLAQQEVLQKDQLFKIEKRQKNAWAIVLRNLFNRPAKSSIAVELFFGIGFTFSLIALALLIMFLSLSFVYIGPLVHLTGGLFALFGTFFSGLAVHRLREKGKGFRIFSWIGLFISIACLILALLFLLP